MLPFLLACLTNNLSGGGGGGAFAVSDVFLTQQQPGTSQANPLRLNVSLRYNGSISGITLKVESNFNGEGWVTEFTGLAPTAFPQIIDAGGFYNKFGTYAGLFVRVTDEADALNTATSAEYVTTYTLPA
jgi:hypothetical protein